MRAFARDLRHAFRLLRARRGVAAVAVLTLALGIGANTAIFSVARSLFLDPLPFPEPDRLALLWEADASNPSRTTIIAAPNYLDWKREARSFEDMAIWEFQSFNLSGDAEPERVAGLRVSASAFSMLRVAPQLGRTFTAAEEEPGHDVVIISDALWRRRFGARPDIVGQTMRMNGRPFEIIGVMPPSFRFTQRTTAVWTPIAFNAQDAERGAHSFYAAARLRPGVTFTAAKAELDTIGRALAAQYPGPNTGETATLTPMNEFGVRDLRSMLLALSGAVALVLLVACANVANLLLAQASARRHEFAVRAALGASAWRMARQLLAEGLLLAVLGGVAGFAVAWAATTLLKGVLPLSIVNAPFREAGATIHVDPTLLAFTFTIAMFTGVLFSLAPMLGLARSGASDLKSAGDRGATGRMSALRATLVAAEVALALVVLVGAGLMVKSLVRLVSIDPGLNSRNVLVLGMTLPQADFYGPPERERFCDQVSERAGTLPGVVSVGAISHLPLSGANAGRGISIEGKTFATGNASAAYRLTCPGYFKTMGIAIVKGRDFDARDATRAPQVVIFNEETAKTYWPNEDPIGKRVKIGRAESDNPWMTVVGIVRDVRHFGLDQAVRREMYRPYSQAAWPVMSVVVRTAADPTGFAAPIRAALQRIDPDLPVSRVTTMETIVRDSTGSRRFPMLLLGAFGAVALALAIVGVYGVVSYLVTQRSREIGIRVALGARRAQVLRLVVSGSMTPVLVGLALGALGAVFASRLLGSLLYNVQPGDPWVVGLLAIALAGAAVAASLVPARRATRVDPMQVLRAE